MPADGRIAVKYRAFKYLLSHNHAALEHIAQLEQVYFGGKPFSLAAVRVVYVALLEDGTQQTYTPAEFAAKFGWKNEPKKATLLTLDE